MSGFLTTHVLDTARGCPAAGLRISLYRYNAGQKKLVRELTTNDDGRTDHPILQQNEFSLGTYVLVFESGDYLSKLDNEYNGFFDSISIQFTITEDDHYHVPLLLSPFGYSTYRGS